MEKSRVPWEKASTYLNKRDIVSLAPQGLDNDETTIEKERLSLQKQLALLNPAMSVVSVERDEDGTGDSFILNTLSLQYTEMITALFKENAIQYSVEKHLEPVPLEGGPSTSYRPMQRTVVVYRRALKKLKRSPYLTLFYSILCLGILSFVGRLFFRIVL